MSDHLRGLPAGYDEWRTRSGEEERERRARQIEREEMEAERADAKRDEIRDEGEREERAYDDEGG